MAVYMLVLFLHWFEPKLQVEQGVGPSYAPRYRQRFPERCVNRVCMHVCVCVTHHQCLYS